MDLNYNGIVTEINNLKIRDNIPVGTIILSANATVPEGYLLCNGSIVNRTAYSELFEAIGTTYGEGDGSTTFTLPNLIGKFIEGSATAGIAHEAGLPNIVGAINGSYSGITAYDTYLPSGVTNNAFYTNGGNSVRYSDPAGSNSSKSNRTILDASLYNPIYGNSDTVQPPSVTALPCIKAFDKVVSDATIVISQLANDINNRANMDLSNVPASKGVLTSSWKSGTEWYRVYSDGWIEQGGTLVKKAAQLQVTLLKSFTNTDYSANYAYIYVNQLTSGYPSVILSKTTSTFTIVSTNFNANDGFYVNWTACGY